MQSKASMVISCYNKEKLIGGMFESILAQEWNNIELILVNDGSIDKTRDIIAEYEPKFRARGFEVVIIDQENQGVSAAVRKGLMRVSGDYVCLPDADDELDPRYISMMAGWLEGNLEYDWAVCDAIRVGEDFTIYHQTFSKGEQEIYKLKNWIFWKIQRGIWVYLVRTEYLKRCNVLELFYIGRDGNQEPQFVFPLALGGGKIKYFREPLYTHITTDDHATHRSYIKNYESSNRRWSGFIRALNEIIHRLPVNDNEKLCLCAMSELNHTILILRDALRLGTSQDVTEVMDRLLRKVRLYFTPSTAIEMRLAYAFLLPWQFSAALENNILGTLPVKNEVPPGRVIAWGALGKNARSLFPDLIGTSLEPTEFWDTEGDGKYIKKPDVSSLTEQDTVLILPSRMKAVSAICTALEGSGCRVIPYDDIRVFLSALRFPEFYDGTIRFAPEGVQ